MKNFFKKKNESANFIQSYDMACNKTYRNVLDCTCIYKSPMVNICAEACACCWDKPVPQSFGDKLKYLANRANTGHTSIFEHSNLVLYIEISDQYIPELLDIIDTIRYLETAVRYSTKTHTYHALIGGTLAGYYHLLNNIRNFHNNVLNDIIQNLYMYAPSAAFETLINDGILERDQFSDIDDTDINSNENYDGITIYHKSIITCGDHIDIRNLDSIDLLVNNIKYCCADPEIFDIADLIRMVSCTVLFKNMSRTATHQLVRHRNGITQESQRYVNYSNAAFANPATFKPDKYDKNHRYFIRFGGIDFEMTLEEIGLAEQGIYGWLQDPILAGEEYHLLKEDARAFLPSNIICKKLYMTYTYKNLFKFLQLREDKHAQVEIRLAASELGVMIRDTLGNMNIDFGDIYDYTKPYYILKDKIEENKLMKIENEESNKNDNWVEEVIDNINKEEQ